MESIDLERERRLVELLEIGLDHPISEQRTALSAVCDDDSLVEETLQLLLDEDDEFLARPAIEEMVGRVLPGGSQNDARDVRTLIRNGAANAEEGQPRPPLAPTLR